MIRVKNDWVQIEGNIDMIMAELTVAIKGVHDVIAGNFGDVIARECIAKVGCLAFASEDEIKSEHDEIRGGTNELRSADR